MGRSRSAPSFGERRERDQEPNVSIVPTGTDISFCIISQHFVLGYFHWVPSSFAPPSPRCGAAFVLRARRSPKSKGGLRATADRPGPVLVAYPKYYFDAYGLKPSYLLSRFAAKASLQFVAVESDTRAAKSDIPRLQPGSPFGF